VEFAKLTGNVSIETDFPRTSGGGPIVDLKTYRGSIRLRAL
jgi:hypothetical protein